MAETQLMSNETTATSEGVKDKVRAFLAKSFRNHQFGDSENIFDSGFVNSMFALQLVMFVEKQFSVQLDDEDLDLSNFCSVNAIDALIAKHLNAKRQSDSA